MNPSNFPNDSRENRRIITDEDAAFETLLTAANELVTRDFLIGFQNRDVEMVERKSTDIDEKASLYELEIWWAQEKERIQRIRAYDNARKFAFSLHSDQNLKIVEKKEEEEVKGDEDQSEFQKAKEAIKKRREKISTTSYMEIDLVMQRKAPTLMELSLRVLAQNSEAIKSLKLVPDYLRKKLSNHVSALRRVDTRFMQLLIEDSPNEICARNCVDLEEDDLIKIFCDCDRVSLKVS